ncbi:hypothetical protein G4B88_002648 [Cannabis sativa]|uniref:RNase H type-1 domain-containing protein n=1 Tax=Cannabis sativa TaxID=3483 RepID=A0A7J6I9G1_CANSA|nr:hypothetical protein G4B88_002648 [Cannabis sativa]
MASIFGSNIGRCMLCGSEEMDVVSHFVLGCDVTRSLWFSSPWGLRIQSFNLGGGRELVSWLLEPRNDIFHNNGALCLAEVRKAIDRSFAEHKPLLKAGCDIESNQRAICAVRWALTRPVRMRCYVDFASAGEIFAAATSKVRVHSVVQGELEAVRFGLNMAVLLEVDVGTFFSDNQTFVKALAEESSPLWQLHFSFDNVLRTADIRNVAFCWIPQMNNKAAHALARWGLSHSCNGLLNFWEVSPHVLTKLLVPV